MVKWIRLLSAGLLGLLGAACRPFGSQLMPDSAFSTADFTPDGGRILVDSYFSKQVYLYDLAAEKILWSLPARTIGGASFSPGGKFAIFVDLNPNDPTAQLSVIRLADGAKSAFARGLGKFERLSDRYYSTQAANLTAVSDDGAWVILAYTNGPLEVYSTTDGRLIYQAEKRDVRVDQVSIEPGDKRVAVRLATAERPNVEVLEQANGKWSRMTTLENVSLHAWTSAGLAMVTPRGIELWSGGEPRLVVPLVQRRDEQNVYEIDGAGKPCVYFAPDGAFAAASTSYRFDVFDLKSGTKIFSHKASAGTGSHPGVLSGAAFTGHHLRGFLETGDFIDVDLSIPQIVKTVSFGSPGHYSKNWFTDGSSWVSNYMQMFGPGGRYIDLYEEKIGHQIYPLP